MDLFLTFTDTGEKIDLHDVETYDIKNRSLWVTFKTGETREYTGNYEVEARQVPSRRVLTRADGQVFPAK